MKQNENGQTVRYQVELERDLHFFLRMTAIEQGTTASAIVRRLIFDWRNGHDEQGIVASSAYRRGIQDERRRLMAAITSEDSSGVRQEPRLPVPPAPRVSTYVDRSSPGNV